MVQRPTEEQFHQHKIQQREFHKKENALRDVILGGQDGLVNALGIILGVLVASNDVKILIATVIAATIAESISMGAVAYTSQIAQRDYYLSERELESKEVDKYPQMEKEELRRVYEEKGITGDLLEKLVDKISSNKKVWVDVMMAEELQIVPIDTKDVLKSSIIVTIATTIGHLIPVAPFFFMDPKMGLITAIVISTLTLFAVGIYQALTLVGSWWKSGLRMVIIGMGAALLGFIIAKIFHAVI